MNSRANSLDRLGDAAALIGAKENTGTHAAHSRQSCVAMWIGTDDGKCFYFPHAAPGPQVVGRWDWRREASPPAIAFSVRGDDDQVFVVTLRRGDPDKFRNLMRYLAMAQQWILTPGDEGVAGVTCVAVQD